MKFAAFLLASVSIPALWCQTSLVPSVTWDRGPMAPDPATLKKDILGRPIIQLAAQPATQPAQKITTSQTPSKALVYADAKTVPDLKVTVGSLIQPSKNWRVEFRNTSKATLIGYSFEFTKLGEVLKEVYFDGLDNLYSLTSGGGIKPGERFMVTAHTYFMDTNQVPDVIRLKYALFDDGTFYGAKSEADRLMYKAGVRLKAFKALQGKAGPISAADTELQCIADAKCGGKYTAPTDAALVKQAMVSLQVHARATKKPNDVLTGYVSSHTAYPRVLKMKPTAQVLSPIKPLNIIDGWVIGLPYTVLSNCQINSPGNPYRNLSHGILQFGCQYSATQPENPYVYGYGIGYRAYGCTNLYNPNLTKTIPHSAVVLDDPLVAPSGMTVAQLMQVLPRHTVEAGISSTLNNDGVTMSELYEYSEPYSPQAQTLAPGLQCTFIDPLCTFGNGTNPNCWAQDLGGITELTFNNTSINYSLIPGGGAGENPGFPLANYVESQYCSGARSETSYLGPAALSVYPDTGASLECTSPGTASNGGPGEYCNPFGDCCCCIAEYGPGTENTICNIACGGSLPAALCTTQPSAAAYIASIGDLLPNTGDVLTPPVTIPPTAVGVFRGGQAFLLDSNYSLSYDSADQFYPNFYSANQAPLGGPQAGDKPVSGNWTGDGISRIGIYRQSTGQWFLDITNDGIFGPGDVIYSFLGAYASDVPVVGDWSGLGKDCVGVRRAGYLWVLDNNCNGNYDGSDNVFAFGGVPGDIPIVGYWAGHKAAQVGVFRCYVPLGGSACASPNYFWVIDDAFAFDPYQNDHNVAYGPGSGTSQGPAPFAYGGVAGDIPVVGNWNGSVNGASQAGIFRSGTWLLDADGTHQYNSINQFGGSPGDLPVVGKW
jgi:hypothetical protein